MTPADFIAAFPKFGQVDTDDIQRWITRALVSPGFNTDRWGDDLAEGLGNYVAHSLVEEGVRNVPIAVDAARAGPQGGSWRADIYMMEADPLMLTPYGRRYLRLRDAAGWGGTVG